MLARPTRSANKMSERVNDLFVRTMRFIIAATTYRAFVTLAPKSVVVAATINGGFLFPLTIFGPFPRAFLSRDDHARPTFLSATLYYLHYRRKLSSQ